MSQWFVKTVTKDGETMKIDNKKLIQTWNYFKKGRNEVALVLLLYNMLLSYSIKFDVDFTLTQYAIITLFFMSACSFLGIFVAEKVEPENQRISPYIQDHLISSIHLQNSLIYHYEGNPQKAITEMKKADILRRRWLK